MPLSRPSCMASMSTALGSTSGESSTGLSNAWASISRRSRRPLPRHRPKIDASQDGKIERHEPEVGPVCLGAQRRHRRREASSAQLAVKDGAIPNDRHLAAKRRAPSQGPRAGANGAAHRVDSASRSCGCQRRSGGRTPSTLGSQAYRSGSAIAARSAYAPVVCDELRRLQSPLRVDRKTRTDSPRVPLV